MIARRKPASKRRENDVNNRPIKRSKMTPTIDRFKDAKWRYSAAASASSEDSASSSSAAGTSESGNVSTGSGFFRLRGATTTAVASAALSASDDSASSSERILSAASASASAVGSGFFRGRPRFRGADVSESTSSAVAAPFFTASAFF